MVVISGFLGSGKTTLLRRLLADPTSAGTAVLVNEIGEVGLDHELLRRSDERTVLLPGGCVCCAVRSDVVDAVLQLLDDELAGRIPVSRRFVLETTGLAEPTPVAATLAGHPVLRHHVRVEQIVVTVDALQGLSLATRSEWLAQVLAADVLAVTKTDLALAAQTAELLAALPEINPAALVVPVGAVRLTGSNEPSSSSFAGRFGLVPRRHGGGSARSHLAGVTTSSLSWNSPVDWAGFAVWLSALLHAHGRRILRLKALLDISGSDRPVLVDAVAHHVYPPQLLSDRPDGARSRLVVVTQDLPAEVVTASLAKFLEVD